MTPTALSIVMTTFPEGAERNKALGIWGSTGAIGGTAAWLIGGPITDGLGWEWIFFINVPVAAAVAALSPVLLRESRAAAGQRRFDVAGAVTITAALVALVYAVVEAPEAGWGRRPDAGPAGAGGCPDRGLRRHRVALCRSAGAAGRVPVAVAGRGQPRALRAGDDGLRRAVHPHPVRPGGARLVADPVRARLGRHAGHGGDRNLQPRRRSPPRAASGGSRSSPWRSPAWAACC